ncbi:co-chaperone YbbN [Anaerococcus sp.]|uniref:thioredoxin family protein n=1 Tax=Anaerococcus sp. TaxID=1872515 RepID=UPI0027BA9DA8|nr:thioredoxin domain-containing protein [Anaerococcus sp.]
MKRLNSNEFRSEVENGKGLMLVDFSATWCGPCKMQGPVLEGLESDYTIFNIDVDESEDIAGQYNVNAVPSLMIFKDGVLKDTLVGFQSREVIVEKMDQYK